MMAPSYIKVLFIVLSLVAVLLLPINRIIEVKSLPTHRDSATLHAGVTELHYILVIPFVRVQIINFLFEEGGNGWVGVSGRGVSLGWFDRRFYCMCSCVWKCVKCAFKGSGCPLLFILTYVIPDPLIVDFLDWFSCTVKVAIYLFSTCRSIFPGTCNAHSNVVFPSFHPLLFAVCCLQSGCVCRCIGQSRVPGMRLGILSQ